jgi:hypothetical protein
LAVNANNAVLERHFEEGRLLGDYSEFPAFALCVSNLIFGSDTSEACG